MKRTVAFWLVTLLILSGAVSALAVPNNVQYSATRRFLELLDEKEIDYTYTGVDSDNRDRITMKFEENDILISMLLFFYDDNEHCGMRVWNLIDFNASDLEEMYKVCNGLNTSYKYVTFYVDENDNSITVSEDLIFRLSSADEVCFEGLVRCVDICSQAMETLKKYMK